MIQEYENILRTIICLTLGEADDVDFKVSKDRIEKWKEKREIEKKKYNDILLEKRLIYYSDIYDLETIIVGKNWEKFKKIFVEKKRFEVYFKEIETYRNTVAHGRTLLSYQEQLINGILGDLKTKIILFHNKKMNIDDYFIKIIKVSDNLGNTWDSNSPSSLGYSSYNILRVNDTIDIIVEAYDPKGRQINYQISNGEFKSVNDSGKFKIIITKEMIGKICHFRIQASTNEDDYKNESSIFFGYTVLP